MKKKKFSYIRDSKHALLVLNEIISEYNFNQIFFNKEKKDI